jgi:Domain of unknown function (DUF4386)
MRTDLLRWGGIFSVLLAVLFAVQLALGFAMGVDIYDDGNVDKLLLDVNDNQEAFAAWAILGMTTSLLFFPAALGFFHAARDEDRPFLALAGGFFLLAAVFTVVGYGFGVILPEVADNYVSATGATREALLHDGETLQSMVLISGGVAFTPFALGMLAIGILSLRSGFYPRWLAWATIVVGLIGAVPFIGFIPVVPGRIIWLLISGVIMLRRAPAGESPSTASARPSTMPA